MNHTGQYMLTRTVWPTPSIFYWNFTGEKVSKYTKTKYSDVHFVLFLMTGVRVLLSNSAGELVYCLCE